LPDAEERPFGGHAAPSFRVRDKLFVMVGEDREFGDPDWTEIAEDGHVMIAATGRSRPTG
jgi:hypothetical protein